MKDTVLSPVSLTVYSVRRFDVINIGGEQLRVVDLWAMPGGCKHLTFETGETMTMTPRTHISGVRVVPYRPAWEQRPSHRWGKRG